MAYTLPAHLTFTLITPARPVAEVEAKYVNVPGEAGDFGVLPGHMPLIATLRPGGQVQVTDTAGKVSTYTVTDGFADVRADQVSILAESLA